jgi:hypothetical protein
VDLLNLLLQESGAVSETPQHDENAFSNLSDNQDHNTPSHTHTSTHPTSDAVSETPQHDENAFSNLSDNQDHNTPSHTHTSSHPTSDAVSDTSSPVIKDVLEDLNDVDLNKFDDVSGAHSLIHFTHSLTHSLTHS